MSTYLSLDISVLQGKTLTKLDHVKNNGEDELLFVTTEGEAYKMFYDPD
ncbi:MAG: hypothetical protein ACN4GW_22050 [Desulforhopalus sp.]